jgi:hypothetical protein
MAAFGAERKHDLTDGLPFTVRERTFALRPADGKVCPESVIQQRAREVIGWYSNEGRLFRV